MLTRRTLLALGVATGPLLSAPTVPVLTVSEVLQELDAYSGQVLALVGRRSATTEGTYLSEEGRLLLPGELRAAPPPRHKQGWAKALWLDSWEEPEATRANVPDVNQLPPDLVARKWAQVKQTTTLQVVEVPPEYRHLYGGRERFADQWAVAVGRFEAAPKQEVQSQGQSYVMRTGVGHLAGCVAQLRLRQRDSLRILS